MKSLFQELVSFLLSNFASLYIFTSHCSDIAGFWFLTRKSPFSQKIQFIHYDKVKKSLEVLDAKSCFRNDFLIYD